ncbi:hypothetical protein MMC20_005448 [Loxospora ochrophaea]|nr:hypothetical protein [Loxospora ochrophaea]
MTDIKKTAPTNSSSFEIPKESHVVVENRKTEERGLLANFDGLEDSKNPVNWSPGYKWAISALISSIELTTNLAVLVRAPAIPDILAD